jgi:hypothetical protein
MIVEHLDWAARNAARVLGPRRARGTLVLANHSASVEYQPLGVVGVIGPWNYPVFTPLGSIAYALAAGNAVVFKPSELTPAVGCLLADTFAEAVGDQPVLQVVTGDEATGHALCLAGVDKVALTGSPATGRKVMAACAERLTPLVLELGGKDAMVVDADADLDAAAEQAGLGRDGQRRPDLPGRRAGVRGRPGLRPVPGQAGRAAPPASARVAAPGPTSGPSPCPGSSRSSSGTWTTPSPAGPGRWSAARTRSARPMSTRWCWSTCRRRPGHAGGDLRPGPAGDQGPRRRPRRRPGQRQPLRPGAAVFAGRRADRIARALRSGMTSVNSVLTFAGMPSLPLGGVGESGFGRVHGPDGLREFSPLQGHHPPALPPAVPDAQLRPPRLRPPGRQAGDEAAPRRRPGLAKKAQLVSSSVEDE